MKKLLAILALTLSAGMAVGQVTEDFESGTKTAYAAADVTLGSGTWTLTDALLGTTASDRFNGTKSVRLRNGSLTMKFNASTAGTVSVYHALYGSDASQTWKLQQSIDDGANWTDVGSAVTTSSTSLAQVSFVVDLNSPVRFQIVKTSGGTTRINIDDFSITAFGANTAPSITDVARTAYIPEPVDNLTVTSTITDNGSISAAYLRYTINGGEIDSSLATNTSGSSYSATISSELISDGDFVVYSYSALDNLGAYSKSTDSKVFVGTTSISTLRVNDMNGLNVYNNSVARIVGTASFPNGVTSATNMDWYLQDESAGINIFKFGDASFPVEIGTKYTVSGVVTPFNGRLEIVPSSTSNIVNSGSGILPDPTTVVVPSVAGFLASPEDYEGELASFKNVQISSGTWPATSTFVTTLLVSDDGGVNSIALYINTTTGGIEQVGTFDVVGIIRQDDNTSPFNAAYQIVPRSADDFYPANTLPVELASFTASAFGSGAKLVWSTKTEQNNAGFEVERKTTGNWTS
ncbi:MAG: hypothetical protein HUU10_14565, partial [Bacteroidetes bacterium]|nr:hypothetical protein [Bacteroidota bacterium]